MNVSGVSQTTQLTSVGDAEMQTNRPEMPVDVKTALADLMKGIAAVQVAQFPTDTKGKAKADSAATETAGRVGGEDQNGNPLPFKAPAVPPPATSSHPEDPVEKTGRARTAD